MKSCIRTSSVCGLEIVKNHEPDKDFSEIEINGYKIMLCKNCKLLYAIKEENEE